MRQIADPPPIRLPARSPRLHRPSRPGADLHQQQPRPPSPATSATPVRRLPGTSRRRATLRAELDAWYARAYGVTRDELRYILDPTDTHGPTYPSETFRVLRENECRRYHEYRTSRLVLDAWDRLANGTLA